MAEVAIACTQPVWEIGKCLWAPIAKRINCVRKLSKNREVLCNKAHELSIKRNDIVAEITRSAPQKTPTEECDDWKEKALKMENEVENIKQELSVKKKCIGGLCPNIFSSVELGERVIAMTNEIDKLLVLASSMFERGYLVDSPPAIVEKMPGSDSTLATPAAYHKRDAVLEKIRDNNTPTIGIWGMGGVGKTTVLGLLNRLEFSTSFDFVIWVTVSRSWSIRKLQNELGERLSVKITTDESDESVARKLFWRLEGKKYLLLLDDIWDEVNLSHVGFPNVTRENGCKVVLTTRKKEVCRKMETDDEVHIGGLQYEEAWEMFSLAVGRVAMLPSIKDYARDIVKECDGLPLALKVVSSALWKVENVNVWLNFLNELRSPSTSFIPDVNEKVFKILKVSYDQLKIIEEKKSLLFCGLYPEDFEIPKFELIRHWRAEGILSSKLTFAEACAKGDTILEALIDASLLEKCDWDDDHVKMHDVVRDLVLTMTSPEGEEPLHLVIAGISSEKIPEPVDWKKAKRISFMNHDLCAHDLPESPDCPELLTLLLQGNKNLEVIQETFFNNMPKLRVLDMSETNIESLPTSISKLDSLRELVLYRCYSLKAVPAGEICKLSHIEMLTLLGSDLSDQSEEIVAKDVSNLSSLSSLQFRFGKVGNLQHFLKNNMSWKERRLSDFCFHVGETFLEVEIPMGHTRYLLYTATGEEGRGSGLPSAIADALGRSYTFRLVGHEKLNTLSDVGAHSTNELRECEISRCDALETIVDRNGLEMGAFPNLERLFLSDLWNLKSILCLEMEEGQLLLLPPSNANSFTNLKSLTLDECPLIEQLFSSVFMVHKLSKLEILEVKSCQGLKGMIPDDQKVDYEALPRLREIKLQNSPEFVSFFKGVPLNWRSLEKVSIRRCPKLRELPFNTDSAPNLKEIRGHQSWWDALEWDNDAVRSQFQPFFKQWY